MYGTISPLKIFPFIHDTIVVEKHNNEITCEKLQINEYYEA